MSQPSILTSFLEGQAALQRQAGESMLRSVNNALQIVIGAKVLQCDEPNRMLLDQLANKTLDNWKTKNKEINPKLCTKQFGVRITYSTTTPGKITINPSAELIKLLTGSSHITVVPSIIEN